MQRELKTVAKSGYLQSLRFCLKAPGESWIDFTQPPLTMESCTSTACCILLDFRPITKLLGGVFFRVEDHGCGFDEAPNGVQGKAAG